MSRRVAIAALVVVAAAIGLGWLWRAARVSASPEAALRQRIEEYWQHRAAGEGEQATAFLLIPEEKRATFPEDFYRGERRVIRWAEAKVEEVKIEDDHAQVRVRVAYHYKDPRFAGPLVRKVYTEEWVRVGDDWFRRLGDVQGRRRAVASRRAGV